MPGTGKVKDVSARAAVECIRSSMTNAEVMARFKLNAQGYADLLKQLFRNKLISEDDLVRRGIRFKVQKKPSEQEQEAEQEAQQATGQVPVPQKVPAPKVEDDGFLDTQQLTDLLTLKPSTPDESQEKKKRAKEPPPEEEPPSEKKSKLSLTGFFKRGG